MLYLLSEFRDAVNLSRRLMTAAHVMDSAGDYIWAELDRFVVVEAAFLKTFIAWETFQEKTFVEYMVGVVSAAGRKVPCFAQPQDKAHALKMLIGWGRFVDWSTPDSVRKLAANYFVGGEPFESALASIHGDLIDLKTIRNAAAHLSTTTAQPLDALASRKLQHNLSGISAAKFLLSGDPKSAAGTTIFDAYTLMLDASAHSIVHA